MPTRRSSFASIFCAAILKDLIVCSSAVVLAFGSARSSLHTGRVSQAGVLSVKGLECTGQSADAYFRCHRDHLFPSSIRFCSSSRWASLYLM